LTNWAFFPTQKQVEELHGVGYLAAAIKAVADARVGDTISCLTGSCTLPGYTEAADGVLWSVSIDADQFEDLRDALES